MSAFFIFKQRKKQYYFKTILKEKICKKIGLTASLLTLMIITLGLQVYKDEKRRKNEEIKYILEEAKRKNQEIKKLMQEAKKNY